MTAACHDPASDIVNAYALALRQHFDPASACPPIGAGSTTVRFIAGDGGLPPWGPGCDGPFLWVRLVHRYRSREADFPASHSGQNDCKTPDVRPTVAIEIGVLRGTTMDAEPDWDTLDSEAEISLDDSWRIERALTVASDRLQSPERAVATDTVAPFGPEGGVIAWTGMAYVQV